MMKNLLKKLSSRKLWVAAAGVASGVAMALGASQSEISTVAGAVTALASIITYIVTEGKVDAAAVKAAAESVCGAAKELTEE